MTKALYTILFVSIFLSISTLAFADTADISNDVQSTVNGGGSSNVSITNQVNGSSSSSDSSSNCTTNVVIDSNGEHKEYHGNCGNVNLQTSDGNNSVSISNGSSSAPNPTTTPIYTPNPTPYPTESPTASPSATPESSPSASPAPQPQSTGLFQAVINFFDNLFN